MILFGVKDTVDAKKKYRTKDKTEKTLKTIG